MRKVIGLLLAVLLFPILLIAISTPFPEEWVIFPPLHAFAGWMLAADGKGN
jgi:hypothetical protein